MEAIKNKVDGVLTVTVNGRVDTTTAPALEEAVKSDIAYVTKLVFDLSGLEYISSAGLRVLLSCSKVMKKQGTMVVTHVNETVMNIFEVTGFDTVLTIE